MKLTRTLLTIAALTLLDPAGAQPARTVLSSGVLKDLSGAAVGQVSIERQGGQVYVHVQGAGQAAGVNLDLLVSESGRALVAGDHDGPGPGAVRAGPLGKAEVRYALPAPLQPGHLRTVWVWCRAVRLASARAELQPLSAGHGYGAPLNGPGTSAQ